ncbi:Uncharacterised conserved protein UCP010603 [Syntrophomonas zehnderi OL-4]|uniref:Uncharacterized conserved protein UCP010603 n=1 Tax=Syntrophomonas zehnderi OL-4 TaxID=690567 RepID=A0A0E4GAE0_9FIRM|nr:SoxR reducing system RseC family protein [Syntrophomonas zehnderi]CFX45884.1 Uncharacterised conserved protein UCP010603 [Syntrophomonas zehnderi OL-4]
MSENKDTILVEILQGTQAVTGGCNCSGGCPSAASCGTTSNYEDMTMEMASELKKAYGDKVEVKYVDVDKEGLDNYPIMNRVLQMGYPYPITLINGDPKFAGGIMISEVKQSIADLFKDELAN